MPRLSWNLIARAWKETPLLPLLLRPCRDLNSARLELRWLEGHARNVHRDVQKWKPLLIRMCRERSHGKPLQYILGTEFFGPLEIKCRKGVLIPRPETAEYISHLLDLLHRNVSVLPKSLRVLDLCTGTGCIPLLFAHSFTAPNTQLQLLGIDISKTALNLARENKRHLSSLHHSLQKHDLKFQLANMLSTATHNNESPPPLLTTLKPHPQKPWSIILSNPPYISPQQFNHTTARSVRNHEPKLALVPTAPGISDDETADLFYHAILATARVLNTKVLLVEVGDLAQARRVAGYAREEGGWDGVEIWRDSPGSAREVVEVFDGIEVRGVGNGRSVFCWRGEGGAWVGR